MGIFFNQYSAWLQKGVGLQSIHASARAPKEAAFALSELLLGLKRLYGNEVINAADDDNDEKYIDLEYDDGICKEGFCVESGENGLTIKASDNNGMLYGVYALLFKLAEGCDPFSLSFSGAPAVSHRVINHWDNMTGAIERGYSGNSLFYKDGAFAYNPERIKDYARLLASIGINEISINNVNVTALSARLITDELLPEVARLAAIFRPFGIRVIIAIDFQSPMTLGGCKTADPLDEDVIRWWKEAVRLVYSYVPDLAGFIVKADSEFRDGPASLGRTQADGANAVASALEPFGGICYWRCFVYNCQQDWRDKQTDRPMAAFQHFYPLDGAFYKNVILQIKNGPYDFQVREPNSPLFGRMPNTPQAIEFQITQEYTGHQIDMYNLAVQWEEIFNAPVCETRVTRELMGREISAASAVSNVGDDNNWTGHLLSQANLFAFGRLAWNPALSAKRITQEWVALTFGLNPELQKLTDMMLASRAVYEKYTAPLGLCWMVNPNGHYGPSPDGYEYSKWGTYHRADTRAVGIDRTPSGTGYAAQYDKWLCDLYSNTEECPEELLLFFHRLPYGYRLRSGKTLIQHIYDSRFEGVSDVEGFIEIWDALKPHLPEKAYESVAERLRLQLVNAIEWRDVINTYFYRKTGVPDEKGRTIFE